MLYYVQLFLSNSNYFKALQFNLLEAGGNCSMRQNVITGADIGFLEMGFICIKEWEFALLILSLRPKYFIFIGHLKTVGVGPSEPP